jgi:CheY-like chemotaxis protein
MAKPKKRRNVLVVDDDLTDVRLIKEALEEGGYEVFISTDGRQAMDLIAHQEIALVLLDIRMPELSGYDLLRMLRERMNGTIKIMFVTVVPKNDVKFDGADGFVQKPFSKERLLAEVTRVLR